MWRVAPWIFAIVLAVGCIGDPDPLAVPGQSFPPTSELEALKCQGRGWDIIGQLKLATTPDAVGVLTNDGYEGAEGRSGDLCLGAADIAACEEEVDGFLDCPGCGARLLLAVDGELQLLSGRDIGAVLLPIDNLDEALFWAMANGYWSEACDDERNLDAGGVTVEDGYELYVWKEALCRYLPDEGNAVDYYRYQLHISREGDIVERGKEISRVGFCWDSCSCKDGGQVRWN